MFSCKIYKSKCICKTCNKPILFISISHSLTQFIHSFISHLNGSTHAGELCFHNFLVYYNFHLCIFDKIKIKTKNLSIIKCHTIGKPVLLLNVIPKINERRLSDTRCLIQDVVSPHCGDKRIARRCTRRSLSNYFDMTSYHWNVRYIESNTGESTR